MASLVEWVEQMRRAGVQDTSIGMQLMQQGYNAGDIAEALRAPFSVHDDPLLVKIILAAGFVPVALAFILILLQRSIVVASFWGVLLLALVGGTLFQEGAFWVRPKEVMAGLLALMTVVILATGQTGIRWMGYVVIFLLAPLSAYVGMRLLALSRSGHQEILHDGQRPMVLLAIVFAALYAIVALVEKAAFGESIAAGLVEGAAFINVHAGYALAVAGFCGVYLIPMFVKYRLDPRELLKELTPYGIAILGYVVVTAATTFVIGFV